MLPEKNHTFASKSPQGFTLVELIITMAIIFIIATMGIIMYLGFTKAARDAKRKADIDIIKTMLEAHYATYGSYTQPETMCNDTSYGGLGNCGTNSVGDWDPNSDLRALIRDGFTAVLPKDPVNSSIYYYYYEPSDGNEPGPGDLPGAHYTLCANRLELTNKPFCVYSAN